MVVAQLVERLLPIPQVHGSNPVISKKLYIEHLFTVNYIEKTKMKKSRLEWPILKNKNTHLRDRGVGQLRQREFKSSSKNETGAYVINNI